MRPRSVMSPDLAIFIRYLEATGVDVGALAARFSLSASPLAAVSAPVPLEALRGFCDAAAAHLPDPFLGLHVAERTPRGGFGLLEFICRTAPTLGHALQRVAQYGALVNDKMRYRVQQAGRVTHFEQEIPGEPLVLGRHCNEFAMAVVVRIGRQITGVHAVPSRVWFAHPPPEDTSEMEAFFGAPLEFGCGSNGLSVEANVLHTPLLTADDALHDVLAEQARPRIGGLESSAEFLPLAFEKTRFALRSGCCSLEHVAAALHMSGRTLQRRLATHGSTFHRLVDDVRHQEAVQLLENGRLSLGEVAYLLGYAEVGPFVRAFKRWTGTTPGQYRAAHAS